MDDKQALTMTLNFIMQCAIVNMEAKKLLKQIEDLQEQGFNLLDKLHPTKGEQQ